MGKAELIVDLLQTGNFTLKIHNIIGHKITTLVLEKQPAER